MNEETTLRKDIELWAQQYNAHDAAAIAAWYTKDSVYITPTGLALVGPEQIHHYFDSSFKRAPEAAITIHVDYVRMERPDLAVGGGTFEVKNLVDPNGKRMSIKGPWVDTFVMQGERWVMLTHGSAITLEAYAPLRT